MIGQSKQKVEFLQQLFKERNIAPFQITKQQEQSAKRSLIYKKKCLSNVHSLLFCKPLINGLSQLGNQNQKKMLQQERQKYFSYIKKTFKQKIPEDFQSLNKLKKVIKKTINQRRQQKRNKSGQQIIKRPAPSLARRQNLKAKGLKNDKLKTERQQKTKKSKIPSDQVKKVVGDKQLNENQDENQGNDNIEQNFESDVDLHNDQVDQSFINDDQF